MFLSPFVAAIVMQRAAVIQTFEEINWQRSMPGEDTRETATERIRSWSFLEGKKNYIETRPSMKLCATPDRRNQQRNVASIRLQTFLLKLP